ncbi:MAG: hypothetical protein MJ245_02650 [Clostridia bacterium]|nr:hypothetical protein [Clostridia bacterium]
MNNTMESFENVIVNIDIKKAVDNAYKRQEVFNKYDGTIREVLIKVNPQTMIDTTIKNCGNIEL